MNRENSSSALARWGAATHRRRGARALERQLEYQEQKAAQLIGRESELATSTIARAREVRRKLEQIRPIPTTARVLEVGSGAHGLIFGLGHDGALGVDPLATEYRRLFPALQQQVGVNTLVAIGEQLPFPGAVFDIILNDNVIDHAERPVAILEEIARVLKPGGILYFTVNVHHFLYDAASRAHGAWNAVGIPWELSPLHSQPNSHDVERVALLGVMGS